MLAEQGLLSYRRLVVHAVRVCLNVILFRVECISLLTLCCQPCSQVGFKKTMFQRSLTLLPFCKYFKCLFVVRIGRMLYALVKMSAATVALGRMLYALVKCQLPQ